MKIVIQCAARKDPAAGALLTPKGTHVLFVSDPARAPTRENVVYARPDGGPVEGPEGARTWRDQVLTYNEQPNGNPCGLFKAWQLYTHPVYARLVEQFGEANVYILSAGWGLIRSDFLTPRYDITFSAQADALKRRRSRDEYSDFNFLEGQENEPVIFFGGSDYLRLFCLLTERYPGRRIAVFNSNRAPEASGVEFTRYDTMARINWHYHAVSAFLDGTFSVTQKLRGFDGYFR